MRNLLENYMEKDESFDNDMYIRIYFAIKTGIIKSDSTIYK